MRLSPRARAALSGKGVTVTTALIFIFCLTAAGPLLLGMLVGLFWRGFRIVNGW